MDPPANVWKLPLGAIGSSNPPSRTMFALILAAATGAAKARPAIMRVSATAPNVLARKNHRLRFMES
jgi:hypothetical protein